MYLFFDTETTGFPTNWSAPYTNTRNWPRVVQLAWVLTDEEGHVVSEHDFIIKPDGFEIPADSAKIHGITTEIAQEKGVPLVDALKEFFADEARAQVLVAHNISFDTNVVACECVRLGESLKWLDTTRYCTMKESTSFCKLPGRRYGYKQPKLIELHEILFKKPFGSQHNALADVHACMRCFFALRKALA